MIAEKMEKGVQRYLIIRNEMANENYTTQFVQSLFTEESHGKFTTRINVLGHVQQVRSALRAFLKRRKHETILHFYRVVRLVLLIEIRQRSWQLELPST